RILGGHDEKKSRQWIGRLAHTDLAFSHGFEQRGLNLGRGTVDFVGQYQVMENRAALKLERAGFGTIDIGAGDIRREQIGGELNSVKITFYSFCQGLDGFGFSQTWGTFDQQMAIGDQTN